MNIAADYIPLAGFEFEDSSVAWWLMGRLTN